MFRSDEQISRVNRTLLGRMRIGRLWDPTGPTEEACRILENGGTLSSGEMLLLRVAFDLWNQHGKATIGGLVGVLDRDHLHAIGTLLCAIADDEQAIDQWIDEEEGLALDCERCVEGVGEEA